MPNSKICSYVGFAIKSGKVLIGTDAILNFKRKIGTVITCTSLAENALKKLEEFSKERKIPLIHFKGESLKALNFNEKVKVVAILDVNLSAEILKNISLESNFKLGGNVLE